MVASAFNARIEAKLWQEFKKCQQNSNRILIHQQNSKTLAHGDKTGILVYQKDQVSFCVSQPSKPVSLNN
jgi:hypothetical protein